MIEKLQESGIMMNYIEFKGLLSSWHSFFRLLFN
jgi:hypothetical protein